MSRAPKLAQAMSTFQTNRERELVFSGARDPAVVAEDTKTPVLAASSAIPFVSSVLEFICRIEHSARQLHPANETRISLLVSTALSETIYQWANRRNNRRRKESWPGS